VNVVSFTADGLFIVSGSKDKTLRKWSFPETQDLIDTTMNRFKNRELSIEEQKRFYINLE
jgi:WD40 repeat protein